MLAWSAAALAVVVGAASGLPVLVAMAGLTAGLAAAAVRGGPDPRRAAWVLALVGAALFLAPEIVYVRDPYGAELHRMNTVFKAYFQAWVLLALALPALIARMRVGRAARTAVILALVVPGLPHLFGMLGAPLRGGRLGLDGLRWMSPGDRAAVRLLRASPPGMVLVEAVGGAYTDFGRLSAASGVPAVLGWANHELVWRGAGIGRELERRKTLVRRVYDCGDPGRIRELAAREGFTVIAVGDMEREAYPDLDADAVRRAGRVLLDGGGTMLVAVGGPTNG